MSILIISDIGKQYNEIGLSEKARIYQQFAFYRLAAL